MKRRDPGNEVFIIGQKSGVAPQKHEHERPYVIMMGGRLPETENKRICQISGLKSGRGPLRSLSGGRLRESS